MSRRDVRVVRCVRCGEAAEREVYDSVNLARTPHALDALVDRTFHSFSCACGGVTRVEDPVLWFDLDRGWLVAHLPWAFRADDAACERVVDDLYQRNLGASAPGLGKLLGVAVRHRLVFGLEALREKLLTWSGGLDDVALEAAKLALHRDVPGLVLDPDAPVRLERIHGGGLELSAPDGPVHMAWRLYHAACGPGFAAARALVSEGPWVDVGRVAAPPRPPGPST